jgi:geranylgeranyl diphosphate synthase type II
MKIGTDEPTATALLAQFSQTVEEALAKEQYAWAKTPLFEPIRYLLSIGGKRLRPSLVLVACIAEGGRPEAALPPALAVEIFHNFTLMHDDIMDAAPLRRGHVTVHEKWNTNTAILSGDAMFVMAYDVLSKTEGDLRKWLTLFNRTAVEVCEGQERDMAFETSETVTVDDYLEMIRLKTAVLLAAALRMGAMTAGASEERCDAYYQLGLALGMAFQLQDDYLDAFGDPAFFGKQVGGDILSDKKTYLYLKCFELAHDDQRSEMVALIGKNEHPTGKVERMKALFTETGAAESLRSLIDHYQDEALNLIAALNPRHEGCIILQAIVAMVSTRKT